MGTCYSLSGIIGCILLSVVMTKYPGHFKLATILIGIFTLLCTYLFNFIAVTLSYFAIVSHKTGLVFFAVALHGLISQSLLAIAMEFGVEQTFPVGEAMSGGIFNTLANIYGFASVIIVTWILNSYLKEDVKTSFIIMGCFLILGIFLISIAPIQYKRTKASVCARGVEKEEN
mmetsp:Transcript_16641/g.15947  ORF Transcript_16641/g.15947 Transcript_16641/m.15947 type:complete len:173 (+) Transcript_16641:15-533(+)